MPDLTLYLTCDPDTIHTRLLERDGSCDHHRQAFIAGATTRYEQLIASLTKTGGPTLNVTTIDSTDRTAAMNAAVAALSDRGL